MLRCSKDVQSLVDHPLGYPIQQSVARRPLKEVGDNSKWKRTPIDRQVMKFDDGESNSLEFQHQSPVTEIPLIIDDWTRNQKHLAGVFPGNLLQKCSLLLVGQKIDAFDGCYYVVTPE